MSTPKRNKKGSNLVQSGVSLREPLEAIMTELIQYEGLVLTRCDRCGGRQWCAIEGAALCRRCCPAAVEVAQEEARASRIAREARDREIRRIQDEKYMLEAQDRWMNEYMPPAEDVPVQAVPFRAVAHILDFYQWAA